MFLTLGFSACSLVAPVLSLPSASVQLASVFLLLFCPFDRRIGFGERWFNRWVFDSVLLPLWTTAPVFKFEFIGSSGVAMSVEPTLLKPLHRFNRCQLFTAAGSAHRLNRRGDPCARRFNRCVYRALFQQLLLAVCFRATSRLS